MHYNYTTNDWLTMRPVFGCAVVTQLLTFDTDPVALSALTRSRAAVACFQAIRRQFAREICLLSSEPGRSTLYLSTSTGT